MAQRTSNRDKSSREREFLLCAGVWLAGMGHFLFQPWLVGGFCCALLVWRVLHILGRAPLPNRPVRLGLVCAVAAVVAMSGHEPLGRDACAALLVLVLCLQTLQSQTRKDVVMAIGLGFFSAISGFFFNQAVYLSVCAALAFYVLLTAYLAFHGDNGGVGIYRNAFVANRVMLQALPITVIVVLLVPAGAGRLWTLPVDAYSANVGLADGVAPGRINQIRQDESVAFRVKFHGKHPSGDNLYWRGPVFTYYDGQTWTRPDANGNELYALPQNRLMDTRDGNLVYSVTLEPHNQTTLFSLGAQRILTGQAYSTGSGELVSADKISRATTYTVSGSSEAPQPAYDTPYSAQYLRLPNLYAYQTRHLARQLKSAVENASDNSEALVQAALDYFRDQAFYYTKQFLLIKYDPVDEFMFKTRRGFCEHYASAFVFIMRAAGIPSRVVAGYYGGEYNSVGDYYVVRQSHAHAWAEVWIETKGWVRVDPTAVIPDERVLDGASAYPPAVSAQSGSYLSAASLFTRQLTAALDNVNYQWTQFTADAKGAIVRWILEGMAWLKRSGRLVLMLFAAAMLAGALACLFRFHSGRCWPRFSNKDPVVLAYARFCAKLQRAGLGRRDGESACVYAVRVSQARPELKQSIDYITQLYNDLRYAGAGGSDSLEKLRRAVSALKLQQR